MECNGILRQPIWLRLMETRELRWGIMRKRRKMATIFSQIIQGVIPCYKIYEDEKTMAFLDIHPETLGHSLVVPKVEVDKVYDLGEEDYLSLMLTVRKVAKRMEEVLGKRVILKVVGTDVPHAHVHVMPLDENWAPGRVVECSEAEFKEMAGRLKF